MSIEMLLTHLVLGVYGLAIAMGIFVHHQLKQQGHRMQHLVLLVLTTIEVGGILCIGYHFLTSFGG